MMLGAFEVTALNDGVVSYETSRVLPTATVAQIKQGLAESGLTDPVGMSYNAFLINTGSKLVLIDTGTGGKLDDQPEFHGAGHLMGNLRAAGYQPEQIDEIYITHRGQDHIGGLTVGTARAFPNATIRVPKSEFDPLPDQFTQNLFEPYIRAGNCGALTKTPSSCAVSGHSRLTDTAGHTSYVVESEGQTLIILGDLVLMGALQFAHPSLGSSFDVDPKAAAEQRLRIFRMAADSNSWIAGGHLSFPGIGHVRAGRDRFFWIPVQYTIPSGPPRAP